MAKKTSIKDALDIVEKTYDELQEIANKIAQDYTAELDKIIKQADAVKDLSDAQIRNLITLISLKSYSLSEAKENAALKLACATTEKKTRYSEVFNQTDGTVGARDNTAQQETAYEALAEHIYTLVYSMLRTKSDEAHRIVDALKSNLMSRMAEAKLVAAEKGTRPAVEDF